MEAVIQQQVNKWLSGTIDEQTKQQILELQKNHPEDLSDSFYRNLEFGTGGLRGLMGPGTNRINKYTVGMATQGYSNYLKQSFPGQEVRVAIAHDSRNNSRFFAETAAHVFAANGIKVFLFEDLRPTPELSFAIRNLKCQGGVVCTASHNPKEYNGYKAYWVDGGQLVPPHDKNVIREVEKIQDIKDVKWEGNPGNITLIGKQMDEAYIKMVKGLSVYPEINKKQKNLKIVYTPIHGTGIKLVPQVLKEFGFENLHIVQQQAQPDGNFPTVVYPNPEEKETMAIGLKEAEQMDADILLGTDPDADRVGIGIKDHKGKWVLMNGNQTALLAFNYMMESRREKGIAKANDMVVKTIVTTDLIDVLSAANNINCYNVLTGFKWIAELIKEKELKEEYVIGGEESYGLMIGSQLRDKDAVSAVAILCEMAAYEKDKGRSLFEKLLDLYLKYGYYHEELISITKKGRNGQQEIADMMEKFRNNPPKEIAGKKLIQLLDYQKQIKTQILTSKNEPIHLPQSNVLQFILEDGSKISARPSGTEPKIKFYFSVHTELASIQDFESVQARMKEKIKIIIQDLGLGA
ncbi:MAG: phospho-sugar mutase [Flavisolibacter sp.]